MAGIYMVSAQKPTAVNQSALGHITSSEDLNLVLAKNTLLEIYKVTEEGLKFAKQISIWGVIECLKIIRPKHEKKDLILILTTKFDIMVLSCEVNEDGTYEILTKAHGNLKEAVVRPSETSFLCSVDPLSSLIAIKCYDGLVKLIPISNECKQLNVSTLRMDDMNVIDLVFLHGYDTPTMGVMCKDPTEKLTFKAYETDYRSKELVQVLWKKDIYDTNAFIIPVPEPLCGIVVVGTQAIYYLNNNEQLQIAPPFLNNGPIISYCPIDANGHRFLLSNVVGELFILLLEHEESMNNAFKVTNLQLELLGDTSIADSITYIDNGVVFIGSRLGDSQLIKLSEQANESKSFIQVLETYTNLGPIIDMLIVDIEKQGQGQLITCSGTGSDGCLRIIRSGIGIHESANVELPGLKAMWALKIDSEYDNHLVLSFYGYTKIFSFSGDEFEDIELEGFDLSNNTLLCSNVNSKQVLQVTPNSIRLIDCSSISQLVDEWRVPEGEMISVASNNNHQIVFALRDQLNYMLIHKGKLEFVKSVKLDYEIACVDISPFKDDQMAEICAVGLWTDISASLYRLPTLEQLFYERLGGDVIPRSILIEVLEKIPYLFISLGDGAVISYIINKQVNDSYELKEKRRVILGTQPTILKKFKSLKSETNNIFACSDCPSVICTNNQKLIYSSVNLKQVEYMCPINSKAYPDSLALLTSGVLRIGTMDNIQKLHVRTIKLNESPRRIAYQNETQTFGVITFRIDAVGPNGESKSLRESASTQCTNRQFSTSELPFLTQTAEQNVTAGGATSKLLSPDNHYEIFETHSLLIMDQNTFEVLHAVQMQKNEYELSILSMCFEGDSQPYFVVGTGYVIEEEPEPKHGRIIVFKLMENKLIQVCEKELKGGACAMANYNGKLLVCINNVLKLYEFKEEQLNQLASISDNIYITSLKCKNDFILAGDLMRSCSLFIYRAESNNFELVARDFTPQWLNSLEIIDDDHFFISDSFSNIVTLKKDSGQSNEDERKCLQTVGCIHLGEQINIFRSGSLAMQQSSELYSTNFHSPFLAGTVSGSIILLSQLSENLFKILNELQSRLAKHITTAGKISYEKWRFFENDRHKEISKNYIDGDLIESFLDLSSTEATNLIKDFKVDNLTGFNEELNVSYFTKLVEEISRIH